MKPTPHLTTAMPMPKTDTMKLPTPPKDRGRGHPYPGDYRREVVAATTVLLGEGNTLHACARAIGIDASMLSRWLSDHMEDERRKKLTEKLRSRKRDKPLPDDWWWPRADTETFRTPRVDEYYETPGIEECIARNRARWSRNEEEARQSSEVRRANGAKNNRMSEIVVGKGA